MLSERQTAAEHQEPDMSYTETTTTSWFTRIKNALIGILIGLVLVIAGIYFLFWNEGRAIQTYRALADGAGRVVSIDSGRVDPANDGKLVHITGPVKPRGAIADPDFPIEANGALAVIREVEMYQWVEESESKMEKNLGGSETTTTTYSYAREWRTSRVDSSNFRQPGHDNPPFAVEDNRAIVDTADVGAFTLDGSRLVNLGDDNRIALDSADIEAIRNTIATAKPVRLNQGEAYLGRSVTAPEIGDMKIRFERVDLAQASLVGAQKGTSLVPFTSPNGRPIFLSAAGEKDAAAMFEQAQSENTMITWLIRAGGLVALFVGFKLVMSILPVLGDVVPFIGSLIGGGTTIIALLLTLIVGPVVIAIGWFAYRPLLALLIIAGAVAVVVAIAYLRRRAAPVATTSTQPFGRQAT
jgi:cbb3-type cytochrome oxidase subunit 3